jgi:hypothetical protein
MVIAVTRRTLTLLACMVAVVAAACSNGNSASIPPPRAVEKSTAISLGDSVCHAYDVDRQALIKDFETQHPQATVADVRDFLVTTLTPRIDRAIGDFHRVGTPTKDAQAWNVLVDDLDTSAAYFKTWIRVDPNSLLTAKIFGGDTAKFEAYGFKVCGKTVS